MDKVIIFRPGALKHYALSIQISPFLSTSMYHKNWHCLLFIFIFTCHCACTCSHHCRPTLPCKSSSPSFNSFDFQLACLPNRPANGANLPQTHPSPYLIIKLCQLNPPTPFNLLPAPPRPIMCGWKCVVVICLYCL
jgi:hypothetical protein